MKRFATILLLLITAAAYGQQTTRKLIYFDYAKADLTIRADSVLGASVSKMQSREIMAVVISGHTDGDGDTKYNQALSQARAERVKQYFVAAGIADNKIKLLHFGEIKPIAPNVDEDDKQQNRRVEIVVRYGGQSSAAQLAPSVRHPHYVAQPLTTKEQIQIFAISPEKEVTIRGSKGTVLKFKKNTFVTRDDAPVAGEVTIELVEVYTKPDIITTFLHTVSDSSLLETSGMVYIRAKAAGQELALRRGGFYRVEFPTTTKKAGDNMRLFYGDTSINGLNWKPGDGADFDPAYLENRKAFDNYIFTSSRLGWINCDRFLDRRPTTNLLVAATDTVDVNFCLVFKSLNSVMNVSDRRKGIRFYNVPVGEVAAVLAFKKTPRGIYYASKKLVIQGDKPVTLALTKVTEDEFRAQVSRFR